MRFRDKTLAGLLAFLAGGIGAHRLYLGQRLWWLAPAVSLPMLPRLIAVKDWHQSPAFFVAMIPVVAGFIEALVILLMPDERFDARFNPGDGRKNASGWAAVLTAVATLAIGAIVLTTTIVLAVQTFFEHTARALPSMPPVAASRVAAERPEPTSPSRSAERHKTCLDAEQPAAGSTESSRICRMTDVTRS
jgi:hypothetical protein